MSVLRPRGSRGAVLVALLLAATAVPAGPAAALENTVDITRIDLPDRVVVASSGCRYVPVGYEVSTTDGWEFGSAQVQVTRGGQPHETEFVIDEGLDTWFYCPWVDGLGRFGFGPSFVNAHADDWSDTDTFHDTTSASVGVRLRSTASVTARRRGDSVTFTVRTKRYDLAGDTYVPWSAPSLLLQRRAADGTWQTVARPAYDARGVATRTLRRPSAATYRVVTGDSATTWGATSAQTRR